MAQRLEPAVFGGVEQRLELGGRSATGKARRQGVKDGNQDEGQYRAGEQAADHDDRERPADERAADASSSSENRQRDQSQHRGERSHQNGPQAVTSARE